MATEPTPISLPPEIAARLEHLRRENERLHRRNAQTEEQLRSLLILQGVANTLSAEHDLAPLLRRVAMATARLCSAEVSALYLLDTAGTQLIIHAVETAQTAADSGTFSALEYPDMTLLERIPEGVAHEPRPGMPLGQGIAGRVAASGDFVLLTDVASDPRFTPEDLRYDSQVLGIQPEQLLVVPMLYMGAIIGALEVAQPTGHSVFDAHSLDFVRTLAAQAAVAVASSRLYRRLRDERDRVIQAQEDERKRLGRDLHDGPAQKLAQIAMMLEGVEQAATHEPERVMAEVRAARELALSTTRDLRNLLFDLRPLVLESESGGLVAALEQFAARFQDGPGLSVRLDTRYPQRLPHAIEITVFAIIQEAVNNVLKHAHAQRCLIKLREYPNRLVASIRDDGQGFDMRAVQQDYEARGSWGLVSMLERAALIEGKFTVSSQPGAGTLVSLEVPR